MSQSWITHLGVLIEININLSVEVDVSFLEHVIFRSSRSDQEHSPCAGHLVNCFEWDRHCSVEDACIMESHGCRHASIIVRSNCCRTRDDGMRVIIEIIVRCEIHCEMM